MNISISDQVLSALPHRPPMLLIDEIELLDDTQIVCKKTFRADEYFFQGHYPDFPLVPGVILCECGAQAGAILLSHLIDASDGIPVLTKMENVRFKKMIRPGDEIYVKVTLDDRLSGAWYLSARVECSGKTAVRFSFVCMLTEKAEPQ